MTDIPLVDLAAQHAGIAEDLRAALSAVIERSAFILGEEVAEFERAFASFCGAKHCIGIGSGTDALELAFRAAGVGPGDEVALPTNTFAGTAMAVVHAGGIPRFVDCDDTFLLIDPDDLRHRIGPRTKAVAPVHLFGQMAPMSAVRAVAEENGLAVVEDAAQAHGASQDGTPPGDRAAAACFSFYPSKNLGAFGDAGAVVTNDEAIASRIRGLRNYGSERKYDHPYAGFNSRLDTLQAAVLLCKLRRLEAWNEARRRAAERYDELLDDVDDIRKPQTMPGNTHVWYLYVVRVPERDRVLQQLHERGIGAGIHFPRPLHLEGAFGEPGDGEGAFPNAERAAREILSLPIYPEITGAQQERVVDELRKALP